jgi:hypothetical protein
MVSDEKRLVGTILSRLAESLDRLGPDEWTQVRSGAFQIVPAAAATNSRARPAALKPEAEALVAQLRERLGQAVTREEGMELLRKPGVTKDVLRSVAQTMGLGVVSKDTKDSLSRRIVESTVGCRLRSLAIQGEIGPATPIQVARASSP